MRRPSRLRLAPALVLGQSLREHARALWSWALALAGLGLALTAVFPAIRDNRQLATLEQSYPPALRSLFDLSELTTGTGYLRTEVFSLTGPLLVLVLAVLWGSDLIAGDEDRGTLDLLLANPVSRRRVLAERWGALVLGVVAACAGLGAGLSVGRFAFGLEVPAAGLAAALVATGLLGILFGTIALGLGAATGRRGFARGLTALLAVAAYLVSSLADLVSFLARLRPASPWYHALGVDPLAAGFAPVHLLVLVGLTGLVLLGALVAFERRDLGL